SLSARPLRAWTKRRWNGILRRRRSQCARRIHGSPRGRRIEVHDPAEDAELHLLLADASGGPPAAHLVEIRRPRGDGYRSAEAAGPPLVAVLAVDAHQRRVERGHPLPRTPPAAVGARGVPADQHAVVRRVAAAREAEELRRAGGADALGLVG